MDPNRLHRADLADMAKNTAVQVAAGKVTGLLAEQVAGISTTIGNAAAELAIADQAQVAAVAAAHEATAIAQEKRFRLLRLMQELKYTMKGIGSEANEFDAVGFDPPVTVRQRVNPQMPTELSVAGFSNGVNKLRFTGNNRPSSVTYLIEGRVNDADDYVIIGSTRRQRFRHTGVRPGVPIQYRVRAQAARGVTSAFSNEAVVYRE